MNEQVDTLIWLNSGPSTVAADTGFEFGERKDEVMALLDRRARSLRAIEAEDDAPSPAVALSTLLRGWRPYGGTPGDGTLATFNDGTISFPKSVRGAPMAATLLGRESRGFLEFPERMMRGCAELEDLFEHSNPITPYTCRVLQRSRRKYSQLCRQLHDVSLLLFTLKPKSTVGVFSVKKKYPGSLRLTLDARRTNQLMKPPPGVTLAGPEAFARIEVQLPVGISADSEEGRLLLANFTYALGTADVADAFHRLRIGIELAEYFCFPWGLPAREFGLTGSVISWTVVGPDTNVYPCSGSLPMGFAWSLYFCQSIVERWLGGLSLTAHSRLLNDRNGAAVFDAIEDKSDAADSRDGVDYNYAYVDNMGVFARDVGLVRSALGEAKREFEAQGLQLHEIEAQTGGADTLGVAVGTKGLCTAPTGRRLRFLRRALGRCLSLSNSTGECVEVLLGHCTYTALACRLLLCVFSASYAFVRSAGPRATKIWPTVRESFKHFRGLLALCTSDWMRQWSTYVTQTDASESGYAIATSTWPREVVASWGRTTERSRFKRLPGGSARAHTLVSAGFEFSDGPGSPEMSCQSNRPPYLENGK